MIVLITVGLVLIGVGIATVANYRLAIEPPSIWATWFWVTLEVFVGVIILLAGVTRF